ncbi:hypothetical protein DL96DRAFT_276934 [Flagelloscypha sp. PMI_526]|nr:hypothetical protein DL96DRAFT_276934 [Flagelloscypha sp. PMI_526]
MPHRPGPEDAEGSQHAFPQDAPPSYDAVFSSEPSSSAASTSASGSGSTSRPPPSPRDEKKSPRPPLPPEKQGPTAPPKHPYVADGPPLTFPEPPKNWVSATFRTTSYKKQIRAAVVEYVRDLVKHGSNVSWARAHSVLAQCKSACYKQGLVFSDVLQDDVLEGHSIFYWVVIQRPSALFPAIAQPETQDLLSLLLRFAVPLKLQTFQQLRQACLVNDDQALFQRLQLSGEVLALKDARPSALFGHVGHRDRVSIQLNAEDEKAFAVNFALHNFHQRMMISKRIDLDFIAKSRLWRLSFCTVNENRPCIAPDGEWCFAVSIMDASPATPFDSQLSFIPPASQNPTSSRSKVRQALSPNSGSSSRRTASSSPSFFDAFKPEKPPSLRVKRAQDLVSINNNSDKSKVPSEEAAPIRDCIHGDSLLTQSSSLYGNEGVLNCRWEVRLVAPEDDGWCVIC